MRQRPHVELRVPRPADEVRAAFREALAAEGAVCVGGVHADQVVLHLAERAWWSPWLQLRLVDEGDATRLSGVMGPAPSLWTGFVFVYSALVAVFVAATAFAMVELSLGWTPTSLPFVALALVGLGGACGIDLLGRHRGQGQMGLLRGFVGRAVPDASVEDQALTTSSGTGVSLST